MRGFLVWLAAAVGCGCGGAQLADPAGATNPASNDGSLTVAGGDATAGCTDTAPSGSAKSREGAAARDDGLDALDRGDFVGAKKSFERALELHPGDLASSAGLIAVDIERSRAQEAAQKKLHRVAPVTAQRPPFERASTASGAAAATRGGPKLVQTKASPNRIIDDDRWFERNGLSLPILGRGAGELGGHAPASYRGAPLTLALGHADHSIFVFAIPEGDTFLAVLDAKGALAGLIDVSALVKTGFGAAQQVVWAHAEGRVVFVATRNLHYASESGGKNGFITAVELTDGAIRWQSEPLVANARNFLVAGEHIVSGYGFTAEPDHLFVLSKRSGEVVSRLATSSSPEILVHKGGTLFVRTYDTDLELRFDPPLDPSSTPGAPSRSPVTAPPGALVLGGMSSGGSVGAAARAPHPRDGDIACLRRRAIEAFEARDPRRADRLLAQALELDPDRPSSKALLGASKFLGDELGDPKAIVLTGVTPVRLPRPPFDYKLIKRADVATGAPPRLVKRRDTKNEIIDQDRFIEQNRLELRSGRPSTAPGGAAGEVPPGAPDTFGNLGLRLAIRHPDHLVLIYGGRYVAVIRGSEVVTVLDFEDYLLPDRVADEWRELAVEDVTWAEARGGVLFVENGGGSYAREVFGKKGYLSAIDLATGELLWRSQPLVANAGGFVLHSGHLISGYGFTAEPDHLFVLEQTTGKVVSRTPLASGPSLILEQGGQLFVRTYDTDYVFDLK